LNIESLKYYQKRSSSTGGLFVSTLKVDTKIISILFYFITLLSPFLSQAQNNAKIEILNANTLEFHENLGKKAKRLIGDVQFKHGDALMFCDSAYFYSELNSMDAFSNVRVEQGDSLKIFGDSLKYNGNTRKALLRGNIRLINKDITLTTNFLDYDREQNLAYYYDGGLMVNTKENNTLTSNQGYYYSDTKAFYFKEDVVLDNPKYKIEADTLQYNSNSEIVNFLGPTTITSKDNYIYCEDGWYNTQSNTSEFIQNAYLYSDQKIITGDTLYYERDNGFGKILSNGTITDTIENIILKGDVVHFFEKIDSVMLTEKALLMQLFEDDTLFMHADTFKVSTQIIIDTNTTDTIRNMLAYNHVKFFKNDMQGKADSVIYNFTDSTINFYTDPIIWSEQNQLTADFIYLLNANGKLNSIYLNNNAFIVSKVDSITNYYNQVKGDNIIGYFSNNELTKIKVRENAETIYYAKDDAGKFIGVNIAKSQHMLIFMEENELKTLTYIKEPNATLYPIDEPSPKDVILKGFTWRDQERPKEKNDIFEW